jgi:cyclohexyl-isocyanide hydratase
LDGYRATTHWRSIDLLRMFEAVEVVEERVVIDRNRMTGGGVTAGIDFGLVLVSQILGEQAAKSIQLSIEYNPAPPYDCGSPATADADILARVKQNTEGQFQKRHTLLTEILDQKSN